MSRRHSGDRRASGDAHVDIRGVPGAESPAAWQVEKPVRNKDYCQGKRRPWEGAFY